MLLFTCLFIFGDVSSFIKTKPPPYSFGFVSALSFSLKKGRQDKKKWRRTPTPNSPLKLLPSPSQSHTKKKRLHLLPQSHSLSAISFLPTHSYTTWKKGAATGWIETWNFIKTLAKELQPSLRYFFFFSQLFLFLIN